MEKLTNELDSTLRAIAQKAKFLEQSASIKKLFSEGYIEYTIHTGWVLNDKGRDYLKSAVVRYDKTH